MKILFLARLYYPHIGGVEKHVQEISSGLSLKGHKVTVITAKYEKSLTSKEKKKGIKIIRFNQPEIKFIGLIYTWLWLFKNRSLIKESDIVHCHDVFIWYLPFRFIYYLKPVFTTFHGWEGKFPIPAKNIALKVMSSVLSFRRIIVGEYIHKYYGVKADEVVYGATKIPKKPGKKEENSIVYVGRLDEDTGLPVLLETLDKLKGYRVDFCGYGQLTDECMKFGKVHGFVDPKPFLKKAQICFASGYLSILEAFAHKCVVVTAYDNKLKEDYYRLAPFSEWIISGSLPPVLARQILNLKKDERRKMVGRGYNWAKEQTWEKLLATYLKLWGVKKK